MFKHCLLWLVLSATGLAQTLQLESGLVTCNDTLKGALVLNSPLSGQGQLTLTWTDSYERTVAVESRTVTLNDRSVPFELRLKPAVALFNFLSVGLTSGQSTVKAGPAEFVVTPNEPWDDYQVIMYYAYKPEQQAALRKLGVTAGQIQNVASRRPDGAARWWKSNFRFYCDQMAYEFFAPYHSPAIPGKERLMREAKELYKTDRTRRDAFFRKPCFHDPEAEAHAMEKIRQVVSAQMRFKPFFHSTDETGVANLIEAWDFCFDPRTLTAMRQWLAEQYGSLEGINRQWGTHFQRLDDVTPLTTDEMMQRGDDNWSAWADHRTFMNLTFAKAARKASDTVKAVDPAAIGGLVGGQAPSAFGGYDYWLLSKAIDVIEPYNIGVNREIWRSFAPHKPALTTGFGAEPIEIWRLWYQALHGDRGVIIYDEKNRYLNAEGKLTELGERIAPTYRELTGGIVKQLQQMERVNDPIAVHYSHPSITAHWMIEHRPLGQTWIEHRSRPEYMESNFLRLRQSVQYLLEDSLQQYYFVSYGQLEEGAFDSMDAKVMILPQSVAMSSQEVAALRRFVERGGWLVGDSRTALMDAHCKRLRKGQLDDVFGIERKNLDFSSGPPGLKPLRASAATIGIDLEKLSTAEPGIIVTAGAQARYQDSRGTPAVIVKQHGKGRTVYLNLLMTDYYLQRTESLAGEGLRQLLAGLLQEAGVSKPYGITKANGELVTGVEVHPWRSGNLRLLGLHRNYSLNIGRTSDDSWDQKALRGPVELKVGFGAPAALYDVRRGQYLGQKSEWTVMLDDKEPVILSALPQPVKGISVQAAARAKGGDLVTVELQLEGRQLGDTHAFRVQIFDVDNQELTMLTRNLVAPRGTCTWELPLAVDLKKGTYSLRVREIATGVRAERSLQIW
ncbi:MAG TPA: beta-galactosidase trimerization domain-containing protein [Terriglobia bacterium]|nr:beta-galactosidase trimerization domain-containing protein [Terriglobia bacterium]